MEPTVTSSTPSYGLAVAMLVVGLVLGAGGMYLYSTMTQPAAAPADTTATPQAAAVETATDTNAYAQVDANPYDVQVNPFQ